jgi:hypothetical protein
MRKTNFNSDFDDNNQKYTSSDELEPLGNPEKEFKKCINLMIKSTNWNV